MDQRKKGSKLIVFRNNPQGKPTSREPQMIETEDQRPRKPPIQCWGCKWDHIFRDFPHRGEKFRIVHNIQAETVEDMGRNVPRNLCSPGQQASRVSIKYNLSGRYDKQLDHFYFN
jgi:hypothetical protein